MTIELWIAGEWRCGGPLWQKGAVLEADSRMAFWELIGVFSTRDKAIDACTERNHFISPVTQDEVMSDDGRDCAYVYPLFDKQTSD